MSEHPQPNLLEDFTSRTQMQQAMKNPLPTGKGEILSDKEYYNKVAFKTISPFDNERIHT